MYKMLAIDIDDTLINDEKEITAGTKQALEQALAQGVTVTLATGRMYASAKQLASQLGLNVPLITYQGSLVKNAIDGKILYERSVPVEAAHYLFDYCERNDLHLQTYFDDILYAKERNEKIEAYAALSKIPFTVYPNFKELADKPSTKLLIIDDPAKLDEIAIELRKEIGHLVHITKSKPHFLEIIHHEGTKGDALRYLAGQYGYDMAEVISIGDSWNDHELLEAAGFGVAMGNAVDSLKKIADYITFSNNEDGVKHVVEKFVLQTSL
ncbi:Cof-type HAD-IIB family hydrolase [Paenibacillus radicis (ex Xue et al. 2023)]|uniref:Cof-type HAD-IIB family hydrolase n=1 Tax=Paenibacillus radicis (ex Xue et al. 2023) TaxID=2972489 RepID=A0ABT1YVE9_9BACL|nr:Cof-type HAD-IIB family hydrolase [Paenibacillus radicis (ex Xue et al. 2023)]MCR8636913.1 Cof-type HAD-IIB family hydrolase [Paenibacillus radicis (ex Xue et al. 2023)]